MKYNGVWVNGKMVNSFTDVDEKGNSVTTVYGDFGNDTKNCNHSTQSYYSGTPTYVSQEMLTKQKFENAFVFIIGGIVGLLAFFGLVALGLCLLWLI